MSAPFLGPLLAEPYEEWRGDPTGWWMSEKLDGLRGLWDPEARTMRSRKGTLYAAPEWFKDELPDIRLDVELWLGRGRLEDTQSVVRSSEDKGWEDLQVCTIDIPDHRAGPFEARQEALKRLLANWLAPRVVLIPHTRCTGGREQVQRALELVCAQGGEGLMLRQPNSPYVHTRSSTLLKVKLWHDAEAVVIAYQAGKNGAAGTMGALWCRTPEGMEIKVGTGFDAKDRRSPPPLGSTITYRWTHKSKNGKPRTPSYVGLREDL